MSSTYFSRSKGKSIPMSEMHPRYLINVLNQQIREAIDQGEPFSDGQLQQIGKVAITLAKKGCRLEAAVKRSEDELAVLDAYEQSLEQSRQKYGTCPKCNAPLMPDKWCGNCKVVINDNPGH